MIFEFVYDEDDPWPEKADGDGNSLEIKDTQGGALQLPADLDNTIKGLIADRKLGQADYAHVYQKLAEQVAQGPEISKQLLVEKYGQAGAEKIETGAQRVLGMIPQELHQELAPMVQGNAVLREALASIASKFSESRVPSITPDSSILQNQITEKAKLSNSLRYTPCGQQRRSAAGFDLAPVATLGVPFSQ